MANEHYNKFFAGRKIDPARIALIYKITHPIQMMILKKILRAGTAHKTTVQDIDDIIAGCVRWKEMIEEDKENNE